MFKWIKDRTTRKTIDEFSEQWRFHLNGDMGFSVAGNLVSDFGYLLRYLTKGRLDSFENFERIAANSKSIYSAIAGELARPIPQEAETLTTAKGARSNLNDLRFIVEAITAYVELAKSLELPLNPLLE